MRTRRSPGWTRQIIAACCLAATTLAAAGEADRPNILLIVTDDMGYTDLGAFGGNDIATPNLDRLARQGLRFSNFHAAPSCAPTRAMLMSGTGNHEAGLGTQLARPEFDGQRNYERYLPLRIASLPEVLQARGYRTYMSGKWHIGAGDETDGALPGRRGFDRSFALLAGGDGHHRSVYRSVINYSEDGRRLPTPPENFYSTTLFVDKLISQLAAEGEDQRPFFAWFAPTAPHWPLQPPTDWLNRYAGRYNAGYGALCMERLRGAGKQGVLPAAADVSSSNGEGAPWAELDDEAQAFQARLMELYAAKVEHLDAETGRLLTWLKEHGKLDDTWIIYMNDNGPQGGGTGARLVGDLKRSDIDNSLENLGRDGSWTNIGRGWAGAISAPFRGGKGSQYEGGIRVPAFAWHSALRRSGAIDAQWLSVMDIMPTVLELTATPAPGTHFAGREVLPMRGRSFAAALADPAAQIHGPEAAIALDSGGRSVVFRGNWKLVRDLEGDWELYDLAADPGETTDLAASRQDLLGELTAAFENQSRTSNFIRRRATR